MGQIPPCPPSRFPRPYLLWCNDKKWSKTRASKSKELFHFLGHHKTFFQNWCHWLSSLNWRILQNSKVWCLLRFWQKKKQDISISTCPPDFQTFLLPCYITGIISNKLLEEFKPYIFSMHCFLFFLTSFNNLIISVKSIKASRNIIILQGDDFSICTLLLFNSMYMHILDHYIW